MPKYGPLYEGTRASSLPPVDKYGKEIKDWYNRMSECLPNPKWFCTEDGYTFEVGDHLFCYYDNKWGTVISPPKMYDGWFDFQYDGGSITTLNSVRVSKYEP